MDDPKCTEIGASSFSVRSINTCFTVSSGYFTAYLQEHLFEPTHILGHAIYERSCNLLKVLVWYLEACKIDRCEDLHVSEWDHLLL